MKKGTLLFITVLFLGTSSFSQRIKEMAIFMSNQKEEHVSGTFIYENDFIKSIQYDTKNIGVESVEKVIVDKEVYVSLSVKSKKYLFQQIISGDLSLYKGKDKYYLKSEKHGLREIPTKKLGSSDVFNSGTVSLYINYCKEAVNELSVRAGNFTLQYLKKVVKIYNSCDLQSELQISDKIIEESFRKESKIQFGATAGFLHLKTEYNQVLEVDATNIGSFTLGAKLYFHTNWLRKNRIDFIFSADYAMGGTQQIKGDLYTLQSKTSFVNTMFGVNYTLSDLKGVFKPYLGVSAGMLIDAGSFVNLRPNAAGVVPELSYDGKSQIAYNLNAGTLLTVFNQEFDFLVAFQPKLDMPLESKNTVLAREGSYSISGINFRLTYLF